MKAKRLSLLATPFIVLGLVALLWVQLIKPKVISFISAQIPKINAAQNTVNLSVGRIDLSLLKLQLIAHDLKVEFKDNSFETLSVTSASGQLDIFDLIIGRINLSKVIIDTATWTYEIKNEVSSPKTADLKVPTEDIFKYLKLIPVSRVLIYDSNLKVRSQNPDVLANIQIRQLTVSNKKNELTVDTEKIKLEFTQNQKDSATAQIDFKIVLTPKDLKLSGFELQALSSKIEVSAHLKNLKNLLKPDGTIEFSSDINLEDIRTLGLSLFPQKKRIPSISGTLESNGEMVFDSANNLTGSFEVTTSKVAVDHFKLGQAKINANIKKSQLDLTEIKLEHPSGNILLNDTSLSLNSPYSFSTRAQIESFDLQKLFLSLGLNDIPAGLLATGVARCQGLLEPNPVANCNVDTAFKEIWVKSDIKETFHIVKLKQAQVNGDIKLNKEGLTYETQLQVGTSKGVSNGSLNFEEGFNFNFESEKLDFADVESLADLNIKGLLKIKGNTTGDSEHGIIIANVDMTNAEIDKFRLGNFSSELEYRNTQLRFNNLSAIIGKSEIKGLLHFNFNESILSGNFKSNAVQGEDIMSILNHKFELPFEVTGSGKAEADINGPFDFWKLSYNINAELQNGSIAGEKFENLYLNLNSDGEKINFKNVRLKKTKSDFLVDGHINTMAEQPVFNLKIHANPFLIEEIDHVIEFAPAIAGVGYAEGQVKGPIDSPELAANFTLKQVSYDKVEYPNSQGNFALDKNNFNFSGQFFGRQIQADVLWPWNQNNPFSAKILINDLNPLFLLPLVSIPQPSSDFYSRLSAEIDLKSRSRSISTAEGYIKLTDFVLQRSAQSLKLQKPASVIFNSGVSQMDSINLKGDDTYLNIKMTNNSPGNLRFNVAADLQLRMFHFLVPFAQSLGGNLVVDSQIVFRENSFELFGEGELTDGLVSMKGFPQPIENINTPIEFSKSKIFLNDITGQLGQSDVTGIGHIDIQGAKNIQVNLRAVADNVELNFPDQILTAGKANVQFSGNWLPYTLKVDYKVSHGLFEKNFDADEGKGQTLKASNFLPPQQIEQLTPSLQLDINVDLTRGIIIRIPLLEGEAKGVLNISGSPESPIIKGKLDITPGSKLIFKDKPFDIQSASVNFTQTKEINPLIYVSANSRVADYDINLLVQGPAKNLSIKPTSQPPLAENEIFSLLALGVTSQTDQNLTSETQQKQTGLEVLAVISNQSQLNKKIQEKFGLTVQLAPSVDSTKNIAVPKVVVSKKISNKLNASYSKPFTGNDQNQEFKLQYIFNKNMSGIFNYQNKDTIQQDQITNTTNNSKGVLGVDLEYRDEFK